MAPIAMAGIALAGTAMTVIGNIHAGNAAANAAEYNADRAEENALLVEEQTNTAVEQEVFRNRQALGGIRAALGASGAVMSSGTPKEYLEQQEIIAKANELQIRYRGRLQSQAYLEEARMYRSAAGSARVSGWLGGAAAGLQGIAKVGDSLGWSKANPKSLRDSNSGGGDGSSGQTTAALPYIGLSRTA